MFLVKAENVKICYFCVLISLYESALFNRKKLAY
jgi:hypothetical protein